MWKRSLGMHIFIHYIIASSRVARTCRRFVRTRPIVRRTSPLDTDIPLIVRIRAARGRSKWRIAARGTSITGPRRVLLGARAAGRGPGVGGGAGGEAPWRTQGSLEARSGGAPTQNYTRPRRAVARVHPRNHRWRMGRCGVEVLFDSTDGRQVQLPRRPARLHVALFTRTGCVELVWRLVRSGAGPTSVGTQDLEVTSRAAQFANAR